MDEKAAQQAVAPGALAAQHKSAWPADSRLNT